MFMTNIHENLMGGVSKMKRPTFPGFTAEISLYEANGRYMNAVQNPAFLIGSRTVRPQLRHVRVFCGDPDSCDVLDQACGRLGGGMSSLGDGWAACDFSTS